MFNKFYFFLMVSFPLVMVILVLLCGLTFLLTLIVPFILAGILALALDTNKYRWWAIGIILLASIIITISLGTKYHDIFLEKNYSGPLERARITVARIELNAISEAIDNFRHEKGTYPLTIREIRNFMTISGTSLLSSKWSFKDPWNNEIQYRYPGRHPPKPYDIYSLGRDGKESDYDIGNWTKQGTGFIFTLIVLLLTALTIIARKVNKQKRAQDRWSNLTYQAAFISTVPMFLLAGLTLFVVFLVRF